jgi:hypothetical protein
MLLSHTDSPFEHVTLLVRADHAHAELWLGDKLELTLLAQVVRPELPQHDHTTDTGEIHHDEAEREYQVLLEKAIATQVAERNAEAVWLVMEAELLHRVSEKLSPDLQKKVTHALSHDLMKEELQTVLSRVQKEGSKLV